VQEVPKPTPLRSASGRGRLTRRSHPAAAGLAALALGALTAGGMGRDADRRLYRAVNTNGSPAWDAFFKSVTEFGSIWASAAAATVLAARRHRREALDALGAAGAMWLLGQGLKRVFRRPRPYESLAGVRLRIHRPRGTSWPSSHPAVLLAFATVACRDLDASPGGRAVLAGLAGVVGGSRVYLGVHYPADVAGGFLLGRGVADAWTAFVSPVVLGRPPSAMARATLDG
jgi:membrane-associated phospholipid phosphatase